MRSQKVKNKQRRRKSTALLLILSCIIAVIPAIPLGCFTLTAEKADTEEITIVREETDRRTANEKHYLCSDGSMMAVAYSGDIHYQDENGKYQIIDNTLSYNAAKGQYRSTGNPNFRVAFASSAGQPGVMLQDAEGNALVSVTSVALSPMSVAAMQALTAQTASLTVRNEAKVDVTGMHKESAEVLSVPEMHAEIAYQNAHGSGISSEYIVDGNSLKENVIFDYPTSYTAIETRYMMDGLTIEVNDDGSLILYNGENEAVYVVQAPYMYDASGAECPAIAVSATRSGDTWTVRYIPDESWRTSSERVYPVVFDPNMTTVTNTNIGDSYNIFDNGVFRTNVVNDLLCVSSAYLSNGITHQLHSYLNPTYPQIPEGNTATQIQIVLTKYMIQGNGTIQLHPITNGTFATNEYTYGSWVGAIQYDDTNAKTTYSLSMPASELTRSGNEKGYVLIETYSTATYRCLQWYSSRATNTANRPKTVVTYVPEGVTNKVTTLYNAEMGSYLTASSDTLLEMTETSTAKSLWKFQPVGMGSFRILSQYHSGKSLKANADGSITLENTPSNTADQSYMWYVRVLDGQYYILNEQYLYGMYAGENASGDLTCRIDIGFVSSSEQRQWQMLDLAPGVNGIQTNLANPEAGGFLVPSSDSTVGIVSGVTKDRWEFVQSTQQSFQIVSVDYPEKCLAAAADGNLSLVTKSSSTAATTQYWYLLETVDGYNIVNVSNDKYLYAKNTSGNLSCAYEHGDITASLAERVWTFMDYNIPYEVFALKNTDLYLTDETNENSRIDLYLKNMTGKNYNLITINPDDPTEVQYNYDVIFGLGADNRINAMNYLATTSLNNNKNSPEKAEAIGDMCGFRLKYESSENAYRLMPLSSGNGHQRALTVPAVSLNAEDQSEAGINSMVMYKCTDTYKPRQLFLLEMQMNGQFVIKLKSSPSLVLTASKEANNTTGNVTMSARSDTLINQIWIMEEYMAYLPKNDSDDTEYPKVSYKLLEEYYASKGFLSPLGDFDLTVTSDYGQRNPGDGSVVHKGIDLRTRTETSDTDYRRDLIAPIGGTVVGVNTTDRNADSGLFIKIDTGIPAYEGSEYTICIIYMHMDSVSVTSGRVIAGQKVGVSGDTGAGSAHLHYGVFLRKSGESYSANSNPLNPLLFMEPEYYANGEYVRLPQA